MFSDKELQILCDKVYDYDERLNRRHLKEGQTSKNRHYYVLKVKDTKKDEENGFQAMAVVPLDKNGKTDYSQVTIAFAGTGDAKKDADNYVPGIKKDRFDVQEDVQGFAEGQRNKLTVKKHGQPTTVDSQFKSALEFTRQIKKDNPKAKITVTGHSLGGATALLVASHYHIPAKVYSAPDPWKVMTNKERLWSVAHPEMLLNYRHEGDLLSDTDSKALRVNGATGTTIWTKSTKPDDVLGTHNLKTFVFNQTGKIKTVPNLNEDLNLYQGKLTAIKSLARSMAKSGGKMTHSEKIFLDVAEALAMSASLTKMATDGLDQIIKECHTAINSFDPIWQDTIKAATSFAEHCNHAEVMAALADGGATKKTMVDDPTAEFTAKIKQAQKIKADYVTLGQNVKAAVNKVVADDQELAQGFS
ncbi:hypothetical protein GNF18_07720 [Ligilactobacillus pobuzihii]|uniref:lipase family protein n=1 Tax=Ligilactobacillus pobuzihii TaxID=449659 RepID=UPI0019D2BA1C|nr:hypothetical protein [Ligilactobacillus pobuzihii]MBN7275022.1 hypothetical protein [Ligilactobacillus pobuzihii]